MIDEHDLREILQRRASAIPAAPADPNSAVRRGRRRQLLTGSVSLLVAVGLIFGALTGVKALQSSERIPLIEPTPSLERSPSLVTDGERVGFLGLAPDGAEESQPAVGDLEISFDYFCCPGHTLNVYADGRMIWTQFNIVEPGKEGNFALAPQGANEEETGYLEQRLTPEGVELLRSELISSGLFQEDHLFLKRTSELGIAVRRGGGMITLRASTAQHPLGATKEQAREIARLTEILRTPEAWLPDEAWEDRTIRAFVPARYFVLINFYSNGSHTPADPSELPPPADDLLRAADVVTDSLSCQVVTTAEARRIHAELSDAFGPDLVFPPDSMGVPVTISSALPHETDCSSAV